MILFFQVEDFLNFKQFMYRLNEWCASQRNSVREMNVKKMVDDAKIHLSQEVLVKLAIKSPSKSTAGGEEACWHRGQISSIESL